MQINENTLVKLDHLVEGGAVGAVVKAGIKMAPKVIKGASVIGGKVLAAAKTGGGGAVIVDPSLSRGQAAKNSAVASGLGTALINSPALLSGNIPGAVLGTVAGMAAAKGGALGGALAGGRDTLAKSAIIPAGIVAASAPLTDMALNAVTGEDRSWIDPGASAAITGALGTGMWAMRNKGQAKQYI